MINEYAYTNDSIAGFRLNYHVNDNVDGVIGEGFGYSWSNEQVGDSIVTGDGPWFVSVEEIWAETDYRYDGQASYTIVEVDGVLKIANRYWPDTRATNLTDFGAARLQMERCATRRSASASGWSI